MSKGLPEYSQGISHARVRHGNINQEINVLVTDGSVPGFGLWQWNEWVERVEGGAPGPAAKATRLALQGGLVHRDGQDNAAAAVNDWISSSRSGASMTIGIRGKHGTGLTSCLFTLAARLVPSVGEDAIFIVDDVDRFFRTDLTRVLPDSGLLVLIVDDADEQSAHAPIRQAVGKMRVCTIYSTSDLSYAGVMASLNTSGVGLEIILPDVPTPLDVKSLQLLHKRQNLSLAESHSIRRGNFRTVSRILSGSMTTPAVTQRLGDLRKSDTRPVSAASEFLQLSTARDTPIPQALLRRALKADVPDEVMRWVQVRPYVGQRGRTGNLLWIEDRAAALAAEDAWRLDGQLDTDSYEESIQNAVQALLAVVSVHSAAERTFVRRLWRRLPATVQKNLARENAGFLLDVVDNEQRTEVVFGWLPILQLAGVDVGSIAEDRFREMADNLDDGAGLILAMQALGGDEVVRKLATQVDASHLWSSGSWAQFIAMLEHVPEREASVLLQAAMPWLKARNDLAEILSKSNTCQLLLPLVAEFGSSHDRLHIRTEALPLIRRHPHITKQLLHLTGRCIMQRRSALALQVMNTAVSPILLRDPIAMTKFSESLEELRLIEEHESLASETLEYVNYIFQDSAWKPSVQNHPKAGLLSFAGTWTPDHSAAQTRESARFLEQSLSTVPITHVEVLFIQVMRMMAYGGGVSPNYMELALAPFAYRGKSDHHQLGICAVQTLCAFASTSTVYARSAQLALRALVCKEPYNAVELVEAFLHQVSHLVDRNVKLRVPTALIRQDQRGHIARYLIKSIRFMGDDQESLIRCAVSKWRRTAFVETNLAEELLRLGMQKHDPSLFRLAEDSGASKRYLAVTALADHDLNGARQTIRKLSLDYGQNGEGAHPSAITRAAAAMARATSGNESDLYGLVARLMRLGPLR